MQTTPNYSLQQPQANDTVDLVTLETTNTGIIDAALTPTADPIQVPTGLSGKLSQWISWFTNRIKAITGTTNWFDAPPTTLTAANTHMTNTNNPHSVTAAQAGAVNKAGDTMTGALILSADPTLALGAVTKEYTDAVQTNLTAHLADDVKHITGAERTSWNGKTDQTIFTTYQINQRRKYYMGVKY